MHLRHQCCNMECRKVYRRLCCIVSEKTAPKEKPLIRLININSSTKNITFLHDMVSYRDSAAVELRRINIACSWEERYKVFSSYEKFECEMRNQWSWESLVKKASSDEPGKNMAASDELPKNTFYDDEEIWLKKNFVTALWLSFGHIFSSDPCAQSRVILFSFKAPWSQQSVI